ncbi:hypothetical protein ACFE04_003289 [Oxalis oulophora]
MGLVMSLMGKGLPSTPVVNQLMGALYRRLHEKDIDNFDTFYATILEIFSTFNSALPGKHYDAPSRQEIRDFYKKWKSDNGDKKDKFEQFMKDHMKLNRPDTVTMVTGIATPPVAMAAKRAGENTPALKMIKFVPDVIFVPSVTVLTLATVKAARRILSGNGSPKTETDNGNKSAKSAPDQGQPAPIPSA